MDDLFKALSMFQQGVQQYAITGAVNDANAQMQALNASQIDEAKKRSELQNLANGLALKLTGAGATGTQIQSAFSAINPQQYGSVEQMQLEGALSGNKYLQETSNKILGQREAKQQRQAQYESKLQQQLLDKKFQQEVFLKQMEIAKKTPELKAEDVAFKTNVAMGNELLNKLEAAINNSGTWEAGSLPTANKKDAAILDAAPYQLAINYAKIVDPASVAREGEVTAAQKYLLDLGLFSSKEKALEGLKNMRETINSYEQKRSAVKGSTTTSTTPQSTVSAPIQVRRLPNGQLVKVRQIGPGQYEEVP